LEVAMRFKEEMDITDNPIVYKRARKRYLEGVGLINCCFCHYHRGENASRKQKSWKKLRKIKYKNASVMKLADMPDLESGAVKGV
jgi:hypothetical protein